MWGCVPFVRGTLSPVPGPGPRSATLVASDIKRTTVTFKSVPQATLFPCLFVIFFWKSLPVCPTGSQIPCEMELIAPPPPLTGFSTEVLEKSPRRCVRIFPLPHDSGDSQPYPFFFPSTFSKTSPLLFFTRGQAISPLYVYGDLRNHPPCLCTEGTDFSAKQVLSCHFLVEILQCLPLCWMKFHRLGMS